MCSPPNVNFFTVVQFPVAEAELQIGTFIHALSFCVPHLEVQCASQRLVITTRANSECTVLPEFGCVFKNPALRYEHFGGGGSGLGGGGRVV